MTGACLAVIIAQQEQVIRVFHYVGYLSTFSPAAFFLFACHQSQNILAAAGNTVILLMTMLADNLNHRRHLTTGMHL